MEFRRLTTSGGPLYEKALALYKVSFPFHEQREALSQAEIMGDPDYHFDLIYDKDVFVGILLRWETDAFIYVEHFCILPELRNKKYGQQALTLLNAIGKTVILEIDPPIDPVSIRRKLFYERVGYRENAFAHVHPAYHKGVAGHALVVMSCPAQLTAAAYDAFNAYLETVVMGS